MSEELRPCPFCGTLPQANTWIFRGISETRYFCPNQECPLSVRTVTLEQWNSRPIEDVLNKRIAELEAMVKRLMRMVEDRFVLLGNSLDGHLQDCNCAVFLSSRMERDAWSELCYEWHGIYSDWQSANGHQAGKVSENEGSEG